MTETLSHWVGGKPRDGQSGRTGPVYDPATGTERARVAFANADFRDAVEIDRNDTGGTAQQRRMLREGADRAAAEHDDDVPRRDFRELRAHVAGGQDIRQE